MYTTQDLYTAIKDKVLSMEFGINQHINTSFLANNLGVSRTMVREILLQLSAENVIRQQPQKGFYTHKISPDEIRHILEVRLALEIMAVQLAVHRATDTQLQNLLAYAKKIFTYNPKEHPMSDMILYDEKFHMDIAHMSCNPEIVKHLGALNQRIRVIRWVNMQTATLPVRKQHVYIAQALCERNEKKAIRHIKKHINRRMEKIDSDLSQRLFFGLNNTIMNKM